MVKHAFDLLLWNCHHHHFHLHTHTVHWVVQVQWFGMLALAYLFIWFLWPWLCIFCKVHFGEVSNFIAGFALVLLCRAFESLCVGESPHLVHWFGFLLYDCCCCGCLCYCGLFPLFGVWFLTTFFLLRWQASAFVSQYIDLYHLACLMCLAVALLDSSFLAICFTFTAGYYAKSVFPSLTILMINSVSNTKNHIPGENLGSFLWGTHITECVLVLHYTTHQYFCCLVWKMLTDQILHMPHLIVVYRIFFELCPNSV